MKLIIAGSRDLNPSYHIILRKLEEVEWFTKITEVVSGKARGVDRAGEEFARQYEIPVKEFPADWDKYGKAAGPIRNRQMAEYADALLLIWDGRSPGSKNMKKEMERLKKPVHEIIMMTLEQRVAARERNQRERPQRPRTVGQIRNWQPAQGFAPLPEGTDLRDLFGPREHAAGIVMAPNVPQLMRTFTVPADRQVNLRGISVGYNVVDETEEL